MSWSPPPDLDPEVLELCQALNELPGITTYGSCCGHGREGIHISFMWDKPDDLALLLYCIVPCHGGPRDWFVSVHSDCGRSGPFYVLEGPVGDYEGGRIAAASIMDYLVAG